MANPDLVRALDYILNRCDERDIEAVATAVVRRRRQLALFGGNASIPDPQRMAKDISQGLNLEGNIEGMKQSIREYAIRIIRQEAPELTDAQIEELTGAWIPGHGNLGKGSSGKSPGGKNVPGGKALPPDMLSSMIDQFISFSLGRMEEEEDQALRREMGPWPDKYWKSFPQVFRLLISDFLKGETSEKDFNTQVGLALSSR
jgi:hypothetical protein